MSYGEGGQILTATDGVTGGSAALLPLNRALRAWTEVMDLPGGAAPLAQGTVIRAVHLADLRTQVKGPSLISPHFGQLGFGTQIEFLANPTVSTRGIQLTPLIGR